MIHGNPAWIWELDQMIFQIWKLCYLSQVLAHFPLPLTKPNWFSCRLSFPQLNHHQGLHPTNSSWRNVILCPFHRASPWSWIKWAGGDPESLAQVCLLRPGFSGRTGQAVLMHRQAVLTFTLLLPHGALPITQSSSSLVSENPPLAMAWNRLFSLHALLLKCKFPHFGDPLTQSTQIYHLLKACFFFSPQSLCT